MPIALESRAPGIVFDIQPADDRLRPVRLDVAAFVGVTARGPARQPVIDARWLDDVAIVEPERPHRRTVPIAVESWSEYEALFGGLQGPGRLGQAVASFFDQGGRKAWILRIVHDNGTVGPQRPNDNGASTGWLDLTTMDGRLIDFYARNEGSWGDQVRLKLSYEARPVPIFDQPGVATLRTDRDSWVPIGSLLRVTDDTGVRTLHWVRDSRTEFDPIGIRTRLVDVPGALPATIAECEVVEGVVEVNDLDPTVDRTEVHTQLGLSAEHPRWLARELSITSSLVFPGPTWANNGRFGLVDHRLPPHREVVFLGGQDNSNRVEPLDFFDADWITGDERPASGIQALVEVDEPSLLVTPDLYDPVPLQVEVVRDDEPGASGDFEPCQFSVPVVAAPVQPPSSLPGLELDPRIPDDLKVIIGLQHNIVRFAESTNRIVALLDVPPGLNQRQILSWRQHFVSSFAAAYHPWLLAPNNDRDELQVLNPSAAAAGVIARRERQRGISAGPANELISGAIDTVDEVSDGAHDRLHPASINVYRRERDGIRLLGARTLSRTTDLRQLSVRRLITLIIQTLERRLLWTVFEPNNDRLRDRVVGTIKGLMRELFDSGAFAGATEQDSFFVRADRDLNPNRVVDAGQLIVEIGIAPAEPIEFIVVRLARAGDGTLTSDVSQGGTTS